LRISACHDDGFALIDLYGWPPAPLRVASPDVVARLAGGLGGTATLLESRLRIRVPLVERVVLLVDDNPDLALLLRHHLADTGIRVVHARLADQALRLAVELAPDLIVLDCSCPIGTATVVVLRG
jgi:PleD family two-component response regulator